MNDHNVSDYKGRIDAYVAQCTHLSRTRINRGITDGLIRVNGYAVKPSFVVQTGDQVNISPDVLEDVSTLQKSLQSDVDVLFEDAFIMVINKPKGLVVHSDQHGDEETLVEYLQRQGVPLASHAGDDRPGIVHRLDRYTEGLMVIAKTNDAYDGLKQQFQKREIHKKYVAWVHGNVPHDFGELNFPIGRHPKKRHLMCVTPTGKEAITRYTVLKRLNTKSYVDVTLLTGRTHQIRVHFAYIGHPLLADKDYGTGKIGQGQFLQSYALSFIHPVTQCKMSFQLPRKYDL